ncbi:MAG: heavy metal-associated domain-containing protein [Bacteroidales bacterium]
MKTLKIENMHCSNCVSRIDKALQSEGLKFNISLENKTITIQGDETEVKKAVEALDDLGYCATTLS